MTLRKKSPGAEASASPGKADEEFERRYPSLSEALFLEHWPEDRSPRKTHSLVVFAEAGRFKACVNDREQGVVAFVTADSFTGLLEAIEAGLDEDSLDWRKAGTPGRRRN